MKKIIYFIALPIIGFIIVLCNYKPIVIKYLSGNAIILDKAKNYNVKIEGKEFKDVLYENENTLILFLTNQLISNEFSVISIDKKNNIVGYNCSANECYDTFLGNLFQSDMGKMFVLFSDRYKGPNFDTELKINRESIEFYIPKKENGKIHIQLNLQESCL